MVQETASEGTERQFPVAIRLYIKLEVTVLRKGR